MPGARNWGPERRPTLEIWIKADTVREKTHGTDTPRLGDCVNIQVRALRENNTDGTTLKYTGTYGGDWK